MSYNSQQIVNPQPQYFMHIYHVLPWLNNAPVITNHYDDEDGPYAVRMLAVRAPHRYVYGMAQGLHCFCMN